MSLHVGTHAGPLGVSGRNQEGDQQLAQQQGQAAYFLGLNFRKAYSQSKENKKKAPAMKAHANLVFVACGLLTVTAAWPRPLGAQSNQRVVKFMKAFQQAHRAITSESLRAEVGYEVGGCSK